MNKKIEFLNSFLLYYKEKFSSRNIQAILIYVENFVVSNTIINSKIDRVSSIYVSLESIFRVIEALYYFNSLDFYNFGVFYCFTENCSKTN